MKIMSLSITALLSILFSSSILNASTLDNPQDGFRKIILMMQEPRTNLEKPQRYHKQDVIIYLKSRTTVSFNLLKEELNKTQQLNKNIILKELTFQSKQSLTL